VGARAVNPAVADAGLLIHLAEVDGLALLRIFAALHIPDAVWSEAVRPNRVREGDLAKLRNIRRHTIPQVQVTPFARRAWTSSSPRPWQSMVAAGEQHWALCPRCV